MEVIFATNNNGKIKEVKEIFKEGNYDFDVLSLKDINLDVDVVEDGETYEENAVKKALEIMKLTNKITLADDSGLEIDFLDKKPGVYSARYLGKDTPYEIKNKKIQEMLEGVPDEKRAARFVCVIAAAIPRENEPLILTARATLEGIVGHTSGGANGFGYDPILFVTEYNMTTAEMPIELKNSISHRGKALRMMCQKLSEIRELL